jgi:hypothetical protein
MCGFRPNPGWGAGCAKRRRLCRDWQAALLVACIAIGGGCAAEPTARYVYQDGEFGVIAIPRNTFLEKTDYRSQAYALMANHFPEGYEIIRAEEVTEGEQTLDLGRKTEIDSDPNLSAFSQSLRLGKLAHVTSYEEKDKLMLRECRIVYRKRSQHADGPVREFAPVAWLSPPLYLDPNEMARHQANAQMLARANAQLKPKVDTGVQKTASPPPD